MSVNLKLEWLVQGVCWIEESRSASEPSAKPKASQIGCPLLTRRVGTHENGKNRIASLPLFS
ncbi:hypothetical protein, partial [Herbaspirillum frisingense]|uniref:hypothetical protein n=1 Tax=Herbaspirillum frisingense TaxID=92645 RepID=UPI0039B00E8F